MYIYLDESYNLKDRNKNLFININGFMSEEITSVRKKWSTERKKFNKNRRIHAADNFFAPLKTVALKIAETHKIHPLSIYQQIKKLPRNKKYFKKSKLDFEKIYFDLCKKLLCSLTIYGEKIIIIIDNRKNKDGILGKNRFRENLAENLQKKHPNKKIELRLLPSTSDILLEFSDFISNNFYKLYISNHSSNLTEKLTNSKIKVIQIKNPL